MGNSFYQMLHVIDSTIKSPLALHHPSSLISLGPLTKKPQVCLPPVSSMNFFNGEFVHLLVPMFYLVPHHHHRYQSAVRCLEPLQLE